MLPLSELRRPLLAVLALLLAAPAWADEIPLGPREGTLRDFGGHRFTPTRLIADPFIETIFTNSTGFGAGNGNGLAYALNGQVEGSAPLNVVGFFETFNMQVGLFDHIALRASLGAAIYTGSDKAGLENLGTTAQPDLGLGVTVPLPIQSFRLALVIDTHIGPALNISILRAIQDSVSAGEFRGVLNSITTLSIRPALVAAIPLTPALGLMLSVDYQHQVSGSAGELSSDKLGLAALLDFDLGVLVPFRMSATFGYRPGFWVGEGGLRTHDWEMGLWYSGRKDLVLGGRVRISRTPLGEGVYLGTTWAEFVLSYVFD